MKKNLIFFALIMASIQLFSQQEMLIYIDYEPDTAVQIGYGPNPIWIDLDEDGLSDLKIQWYPQSTGPYFGLSVRDEHVKLCKAEEGDTILCHTDWWDLTYFPHLHENYGVRIEKDGAFYYGWFRVYELYVPHVNNAFCFDKYAFCTIPNYPLRWGQTELNEDDVVESDGNDFVTIHPNPSSGVFIVTGENLKHIDIYDILGQKVSSLKADADNNVVDLSDQPVGIYLISVTDHDGKQHTRQVVKE